MVDDPPDNFITTSTFLDDSEPIYCSDSNSTVSTTEYQHAQHFVLHMLWLAVTIHYKETLLEVIFIINYGLMHKANCTFSLFSSTRASIVLCMWYSDEYSKYGSIPTYLVTGMLA